MAISSIVFSCNGQDYNLTRVADTNEWTSSLIGPTQTSGSHNGGVGPGVGAAAQGKGYYPCTVTVTDEAGNVTVVDVTDETWGDVLKLKVEERALPTCNIVSPSANAFISNSQPTIEFTVTDAGSGVNPAAVYLKIDNGTAIAVTPTFNADGTVGTCRYTPAQALEEGEHTITVFCTDYDGNRSVDVSAVFTVDTLPPTLIITAPTDNILINQSSVLVTGVTNDDGSSPVVVTVTVGANTYTPTIGQDGSFSQSVALAEGENEITIEAVDRSGKRTTISRTVNVDTIAPTIIEIRLTLNPMDGGATNAVSVKASDA